MLISFLKVVEGNLGIFVSIVMVFLQLAGKVGVGSCSMMTHGGNLACACLMAVLRVVFFADRVARIMATCMQNIIGFIADVMTSLGFHEVSWSHDITLTGFGGLGRALWD